MYDYSEACPISKATSVLCERWTLQIVRQMILGARRFSDFQKTLPRLSPSLLNARLQLLAEKDIIVRKRIPEQRGYEYSLTPAGKALEPLLNELGKWGMRWVYDGLSDEQLNAAVLVQNIASLLDTAGLPSGDSVIQISFTDVEELPKVFIIVKGTEREVCDENPGHEVDVYLRSTVRTLHEVFFGDTDLDQACKSKALQVLGSPVYAKNLSKWFPTSTFAQDNRKAIRRSQPR
jgi:DNA-binding HxlR family transcriptional regulator